MIINNLQKTAFFIITLWGIIFLLHIGANIIFPVLFAFYISLLLLPIVKKLQKIGLNRLVSSLITVLSTTLIFLGLGVYLSGEGYLLIDEFSSNTDKFELGEYTNDLTQTIGSKLGIKSSSLDNALKSIASSSGGLLSTLFNSIKETIVFLTLVPIYIFLMLYYRGNLIQFFNQSKESENRFVIINEIKEMIQKYLMGLFFVIIIVSILNTITLFSFNINYAIFIGILTGILIIIPYFGVFIGSLIPISIAFITKESIYIPFGILLSYILIQFLEGNFITPKIIGDSTNLNPLIIIIGIIIFGTIGGVLAMIIAVPILASFKIIIDKSTKLSKYSILMSNKIKE